MTSDKHAGQQPSPMPALASYIAQAINHELPPEVSEKVKFHLLDTLAAMVSGTHLPAGRFATTFLLAQGLNSGQATVIGTPYRNTAINAAMANAMFAHADETDDSHAKSLTHPGCAIVASTLAAGELFARSGVQVMRAMALGYDVCCRLTQSLDPYQFRADGHSSHTFGPNFGAAAAAGTLAGINTLQAQYVMSYAAQQASGISCWMRDKDHVEKAFDFGGMAARNGVTAAHMVSLGFTGVEDVFSGERCFYDAYGRDPKRMALAEELGERFEILDTSIKRWSVGSPIQAPLDSMDALIKENPIELATIESIKVKIPHESLTIVNNREMPEICLQHILALMLVDSKMSFVAAHDRSRMQDPNVLEIRKLIDLEGSDELSKHMPTRQGIVTIHLKNGTVLEHYTQAVKGTPPNPMNRLELQEKCIDLMAPIIGLSQSNEVCQQVWGLEQLHHIAPLMKALTIEA